MPSGKIHDRVTGWCIPVVWLGALMVTRDWAYPVLVVGGFVFAGFMFGPDLDIRSVQSKRWGWFGWLWQPYRHSLRHRSWLSHGFLTGTVVRLLYLAVWILLGVIIVLEFTNGAGQTSVTWNDLGQSVSQVLRRYWRVWLAIAVGIELGAMSHYTADWMVSSWKREQRKSGRVQQRSPRRKSRR